MQLLSLIKRGLSSSRSIKPIGNFEQRVRFSENDRFINSFSTLCKDRRFRLFSHRNKALTLALASSPAFSTLICPYNDRRPYNVSCPYGITKPIVNSPSVRFTSVLRPITIDLDEIEPKTRLLDDVSTHFFQLLFTPEFTLLTDAVTKKGFEMRIVGGAVRELLQGTRPWDIDFSTNATMDELHELVLSDSELSERIRFIKIGVADTYGSVKLRVNDKQDFEITELRLADSDPVGECPWLLDSARRDFTFNAMYLKIDGTLVDYHGGEGDLDAGEVVFVGDAQDRIREDALRILRYFRFFGKVTKDPYRHSPHTLKMISRYRHGMGKLNPRRCWLELKKILKGDHVAPIINTMHEYDVLRWIGLPRSYSETDLVRFNGTCARTSGSRPHPCTLLADFFRTEHQVGNFADRLSLTKEEKSLLSFLVSNRNFHSRTKPDFLREVEDLNSLKMFEHKIVGDQWPPGNVDKMRDQVLELFKYQGLHHYVLGNNWRSTMDSFKDWTPPTIPVTLYDLIKIGISGWDQSWRDTFSRLTTAWKESDYEMSKHELLEMAKVDIKRDSRRTVHANKRGDENFLTFNNEKKLHAEEAELTKKKPILISDY